jgi:hypothetical protein
MRQRFCILAALLTSAFVVDFTWVHSNYFSGKAYDLKTGGFLYTEEHEEFFENGKHSRSIVNYHDSHGKLIAQKKISFDLDSVKADFRLDDFRDGYLEAAEVQGNKVKLMAQMSSPEPLQERVMEIPEPIVIDEGMNNFVRQNWDGLMHGKTFVVSVPVPAEMDYFKFRISRDSETMVGNRKSVKIKMQVNSLLIRAIVNPIFLTYDLETRRNLIYEGISSINDDKGDNYNVRTVFDPNTP